MSAQTIQLDLPETVYLQIQRAAEKTHRPFNDVLIEAVSAVAPVMEMPPSLLRSALAQMAFLNDAALWQAGRATMLQSQRERMEVLHDKLQREGISEAERKEEQQLLALYQETILVRAQAAVLLKQRGYDVSNLKQFEPLE